MSDDLVPVTPLAPASYERATSDLIEQFDGISSATACAQLNRLGIRRSFVQGPRPMRTGSRIVGSAITLQFMPQREDIASGIEQEQIERRSALWGVLEQIAPGDVLVIQASASPTSGCIGDMLARYLVKRGATGVVADGYVRDAPKLAELELPIWAVGNTPHFASQSELFPWAFNVPIACGGVLVMPGDVVVADDDGAVVVPQALGSSVVGAARAKEDEEQFARLRIDEGGRLADYYPLSDAVRADFESWRGGTAS